MTRRLILSFVGILLGTILAYFAVLFLEDWVVPLGCVLIIVMTIAWFVWIKRGGLKKQS